MKLGIGVIIVIICLNAGAYWVEYAFGPGPMLTNINPDEYFAAVNSSSLAGSYAQSTSDQIIDVTGALAWIWGINVPLIDSFWIMLENAGIPTGLINVLKIPYRIILVILLSEVVRGIDLTG